MSEVESKGAPSKLTDGKRGDSGLSTTSSSKLNESSVEGSDPLGLLSQDVPLERINLKDGPNNALERNTRESSINYSGSLTNSKLTDYSRFLKIPMPIGNIDSPPSTPLADPNQAKRMTTIGPWRLVRTIGHGATSKVKLAVHRDTGTRCAIKLISRRKFKEQWERSRHKKGAAAESVEAKERRVLREASILHILRHPNILRLTDLHVTASHYIMFFEHVEGVRMLDFVQCHRQLSEKVAKKFFRQLLSAVDYLHEAGIVHRDLKIENVMVEEETGNIKLIDFGLSNFHDPQHLLTTYCGSLYFAAPELLHGRPYCGPEVDVWSLGVILYVMVTGQVPFDDANVARLHEKIKTGIVEYPTSMNKQLRSLLERMLTVEPRRRATLTEVMNHPWVTDSGTKPMPYTPVLGRMSDALDEQVIERLADLFGYELPRRQIMSVLHAALTDWPNYQRHPIVRMYLMLSKNLAASEQPARHSISDLRSQSCILDTPSPNLSMKRAASVLGHQPDNPERLNSVIIQNSIPPCTSPLASKDMYPLHAPSLRNLLTATATSFKNTAALRREVMRALDAVQMSFEDRLNHFVVDCREACKFEVHLVYGVGVHWLQFHRVHGEHHVYKTVLSRLMAELKL